MGKQWKQCQTLFFWAPKSLQMVTAAMKLKDAYSLELTPFRTNTPKRCPFHYRDWNTKVGSQETPGVTGKFGLGIQNEAGQRPRALPRERSGHSKHPLPITQEKTLYMDITRWPTRKSD